MGLNSLMSGHAGRLLWPFMHLFYMLALVEKDTRSEKEIRKAARASVPMIGPSHQLLVVLGTLPRALMVMGLMWCYFPLEAAKELRADWAVRVLLRDLAVAYATAGGWDYLLYYSPLRHRMKKYKLNPEYPDLGAQMAHDFVYTTLTVSCGAAVEVLVLHQWATGRWSRVTNFWTAPIATALWVLSMKHWRHTHFYFMHRFIHPWRTTLVPDLGRLLYVHVHKEHHKSHKCAADRTQDVH